MLTFRFLRIAVLVAVCACTHGLRAQEITFGGLELASTSIKGLTFVFQPGADATGKDGAHPDRMKRLQYAERNANFISMRDGCKLSPKGMDLLIADTQAVIAELREGAVSKGLGNLQLYAVGSSGLGEVCNKDEILAKMQSETGLCIEFISAADEARYSLGFVLPRDRYRSLILDIGGANTKGGYYVVTKGANWPPREWHGFDLNYGTRTLQNKAEALMKTSTKDSHGNPAAGLDYYQAVDAVLQSEVGPKLDEIKLENSALENFAQVYMVGGVVWATSARMKPVQQQEWAISSLSTVDFDGVLNDIRNDTFNHFGDNELGPKVSAKTREGAQAELQQVLQRFDPHALYAGVSLARYVVQHATPRASLYFPTTAAWISGYAREKFRETGRSVAACKVPQSTAGVK